MMLWAFIFIGMTLLCIGILVFLVTRFRRFAMIKRLSGSKKWKSILLSILSVAILVVGLAVIFDVINTAIILVHLGVIWLLMEGIGVLINRRWEAARTASQNYYYQGITALAVTFVYLSIGWYLCNHVWEKHYSIETEKQVDAFRIVQFADSHVGTTFGGEGFAREVEKMQAVNPDVVLITGDYVDDDTTRENMIRSCEALGTLKTTYGVYYSFGNHDKGYYGSEFRGFSAEELVAELEKNGVIILEDESVLLNDQYYLIGRQDRSEEQRSGGRASMEELVKDLDPSKFTIVMDHQPNDYKAQEAAGVDLVLSGHTHGGQFFPINYLGEWSGENDKVYGHALRGSTHFIVTSGISDWAIKFKTGCRSEFVVVDIAGK